MAVPGVGLGGGWLERLRAVESRNLSFVGARPPLFWTEARGCRVTDVEGRSYLDLTSAFGPAFGGHRHPDVEAAVVRQAGRLLHGMGDVHPPEVRVLLLERLAALSPWDDARSILATSGSEAVEAALKTAQLVTGRAGIVAFERGYHGLTAGSLATTARPLFREPFEDRLFGGVAFAPFPTVAEELQTAMDRVEDALQAGAGAILVEPIQGRGGVRIPPDGFLSALREAATRHGAVLVFDEIFTGFGRTGDRFACLSEGVLPDLLCVGKAMGGGLPIGACVGPAAVMEAWPESEGEAIHTGTFLGHPLGCAASLAALGAFESEDWTGRARELGAELMEALEEALGGMEPVVDVRGRGLMIGVEFGDGSGGVGRGIAARVAEAALDRGVILLASGDQGEVLEIAPPVVLSAEQMRDGVAAIAACVEGLE